MSLVWVHKHKTKGLGGANELMKKMKKRARGLRQEINKVALVMTQKAKSAHKTNFFCAANATTKQSHSSALFSTHRTYHLMATMNNISSNPEDQESIFKQKRIVRTTVRNTLKSMDPSLRSHEDNSIQNIVLEAPWFKSSQRLCAYISCSALREVDTSKLLSEILHAPAKDGDMRTRKKLYVPRVEDKNSHMQMFHISSIDDLIANSMNILEPAPIDADGNDREDVMQAHEPVDLFLLPGLAFDRSGRRLGRGGGYYDTFLKKYQELAEERHWRKPLLVALSYSLQILDEGTIPVTPKDMPIDALVSPSGVMPISPAALDRTQL